MLSGLLSGGAADLVKGVGGVIDNLHTSEEEKLAAEQKIKELVANYQVEMEKNITRRWEADSKSDSWLSKYVWKKIGTKAWNGAWYCKGSTEKKKIIIL